MTANNIISSSLESSNGGGLLYTDVDGKILSMSNVLSYDSTSNKIDLVSSRMMDVSNGIFVLSQSQKASIVEGVGQDIDIGVYDMTANNIISSSLESSNGGGLLYTDVDGKILSMSNVLSYDSTSNKIDLVSSRMMDVSNGIFVLSQSQKASIVEGVGQDIDFGSFKLAAESIEATEISITGKAELNQVMLLSSTKELNGASTVDIDVSVVASYIELVDDVSSTDDDNKFTLSNGVKGQIVVIKNTDSHTATVQNTGTNVAIETEHTQLLVYDGTDWESLSTPTTRRRRLDSISATSAPESSSLGEPLFSDKRLKKNIRIIENASEKLQKIRGVTYYF